MAAKKTPRSKSKAKRAGGTVTKALDGAKKTSRTARKAGAVVKEIGTIIEAGAELLENAVEQNAKRRPAAKRRKSSSA
jgi:hypothetical protein